MLCLIIVGIISTHSLKEFSIDHVDTDRYVYTIMQGAQLLEI